MDRTLSYHRFLPNTFLKGCTKMRIALASDHAGYAEKEQLKPLLKDLGVEFEALATASDASVDYPEYARRVAEKVSHGEVAQAVLVRGSGTGMAIADNKVPVVRPAVESNEADAWWAREQSDAHGLPRGA